MNLALFDFDGTLTRRDTLLDFLRFSYGNRRFILGLVSVSPYIVSFKLGLYPNWRAKERLLSFFLKGQSKAFLALQAQRYVDAVGSGIFEENMLKRLRGHQDNGDVVMIVSASPEDWISLFAKQLGVSFVSTQLATEDGVLTGRIAGRNCYGAEKVVRIKERLDISVFEKVFAYGDSRGDREMLALATPIIFKNNAERKKKLMH
jgi:HAD superfamily hydrolase (TIGR01490 family)